MLGLSTDGKEKEKSKRLKPRRDNVDITSNLIQLELDLFGQPSSTPELAQELNNQISIVKSQQSHPYIPEQKSWSKSEEDSTSKEKNFKPYWDESCRVMSKELLSLTFDRLARFGFDLYQWLCQQFDCEIVVLNEAKLSPEAEMVEDLLAIEHCFSSRLCGLRKYKAQVKEDQDLPLTRAKKNME